MESLGGKIPYRITLSVFAPLFCSKCAQKILAMLTRSLAVIGIEVVKGEFLELNEAYQFSCKPPKSTRSTRSTKKGSV